MDRLVCDPVLHCEYFCKFAAIFVRPKYLSITHTLEFYSQQDLITRFLNSTVQERSNIQFPSHRLRIICLVLVFGYVSGWTDYNVTYTAQSGDERIGHPHSQITIVSFCPE